MYSKEEIKAAPPLQLFVKNIRKVKEFSLNEYATVKITIAII